MGVHMRQYVQRGHTVKLPRAGDDFTRASPEDPLKGAVMHSAARHRRSAEAADNQTTGLMIQGGWRYDLHGWFLDTCLFLGQGRELRQRTATLANIQPGEQVLDVGCGTGT